MQAEGAKEQRVRVFKNGRSRAIRIPKEFEFEGDEVTIRKGARRQVDTGARPPRALAKGDHRVAPEATASCR